MELEQVVRYTTHINTIIPELNRLALKYKAEHARQTKRNYYFTQQERLAENIKELKNEKKNLSARVVSHLLELQQTSTLTLRKKIELKKEVKSLVDEISQLQSKLENTEASRAFARQQHGDICSEHPNLDQNVEQLDKAYWDTWKKCTTIVRALDIELNTDIMSAFRIHEISTLTIIPISHVVNTYMNNNQVVESEEVDENQFTIDDISDIFDGQKQFEEEPENDDSIFDEGDDLDVLTAEDC